MSNPLNLLGFEGLYRTAPWKEGVTDSNSMLFSQKNRVHAALQTHNNRAMSSKFTPLHTQLVPPGFSMNHGTIRRVAKLVEWIVRLTKLNVKPAVGKENIDNGDIIVFNHFTRFETVIVSHLVYRRTGQFARTIADKSLFNVHNKFSQLIQSVGAVPNNKEGLLPFLAAEILRGHKVIIFPEGGMVKDKRTKDEKGRAEILSGITKTRRKHHRGAAVLGVAVEMLKTHLRGLEKEGETKRLQEWAESLGIPLPDLMARVHKVTQLVPGTITYFPIRTHGNTLSWSAEYFAEAAPRQLFDELAVEGSILMRPTDMDIHFGAPMPAMTPLSKGEATLLDNFMDKAAALDDLFNLRHHTEKTILSGAAGKVQSILNKASEALRERYMSAIYDHVTLNINHVIATVLAQLHKQNHMEVPHHVLHTAVYLALKELQQHQPKLPLHCSLSLPWQYEGVLNGSNESLHKFLRTCRKAKLLKKTDSTYRLSHRLDDQFDMEDFRMENPIALHANEANAQPAVSKVVSKALALAWKASPQQLAALRMDDLERDYKLKWIHYSRRNPNLCPTLTKPEDGAPYLLLPKGADKKQVPLAVVLVHGFGASPAELRSYADNLLVQGHAVVGVRLPGHGTTPYDMEKRTRADWLKAVEECTTIASAFGERVAILGYSTGGALALRHMAEKAPAAVAGVAVVAAPVVVQDSNMNLLPLLMLAKFFTDWIPFIARHTRFYPSYTNRPDIKYLTTPVLALNQLRILIAEVPPLLPKVKGPVLLLQGTADKTVKPESVNLLHKGLSGAAVDLHILEGGPHGLVLENYGSTWTLLDDFLNRLAKEG